jgi:hypothetical protein
MGATAGRISRPAATPLRRTPLPPFDDNPIPQTPLIAAAGVFTSLMAVSPATAPGALMLLVLVLVPIVGPEPVTSIIAIAATLTNVSGAFILEGSDAATVAKNQHSPLRKSTLPRILRCTVDLGNGSSRGELIWSLTFEDQSPADRDLEHRAREVNGGHVVARLRKIARMLSMCWHP